MDMGIVILACTAIICFTVITVFGLKLAADTERLKAFAKQDESEAQLEIERLRAGRDA